MAAHFFSALAKEGGRAGSGALGRGRPPRERVRELGGGQGGVGRCV